jgi:hypothetical protein
MRRLNEFLINLNAVKHSYDIEREQKRFNVFTALHKEHDEVRLHSRFISYLLSPNSGHGMNDTFSRIFVREILKLKEEKFKLSNYKVIPNENNKTEYKEIDILIINKETKQAIIIENKIFARDSNKEGDKKLNNGYDGQLERYYHTIKKGIDKDGNKIPDFKCDTVSVFYLTMFKNKLPSPESINELENVKVIYYGVEIREWLNKCINIIPEVKIELKAFIQQYLNLIDKMTHNDIPLAERKALKNKVAENLESLKYLIDNFKHIKWHTVYDFWTTLQAKLNEKYQNVSLYPKDFDKTIGEVTHSNSNKNFGVLFDTESGKKAYISGENILSWGIVQPQKVWADFRNELLENISFSDFSTENTYRLIDNKNMETAIDIILAEISENQNRNFENLKEL